MEVKEGVPPRQPRDPRQSSVVDATAANAEQLMEIAQGNAAAAVVTQYLQDQSSGHLAFWLGAAIDRQLQRLHIPPSVSGPIAAVSSGYLSNPFLLWTALVGLWSLAAVVPGAGLIIGAVIVKYIAVIVATLKSTISSPWSVLALGVAIYVLVECWVRASRSHPYLLGLLEIGIGIGAAVSGFTDPETKGEYTALFALFGGFFTALDGRDRMGKESR